MTFQIQPANLPFPGLAYEPGKDRKGAEALPHPHAVTTNAGQTLAAGLHQSHSNSGSEPRLPPTPQLTAVPDP